MRKFYIKTKQKSCYPFDTWITKLEMRAFGWTYKGLDTDWYNDYDVSFDWDNDTATVTRRHQTYTTFKRVEPYSYNIFFKFWEMLMVIHSWIRRKLIWLLFGLLVIVFGISIVQLVLSGYLDPVFWIAVGILGYIYGTSLVYALFGFLTRKIFRIDHKLKNRLEANGYERDQRL